MNTPRFQILPDHPDFLDLPWDQPVDDWQHERVVEMPTGLHRHPVVFVAYTEGVYAIKELPRHVAEKEYKVLSALQQVTQRVAQPAGLVDRTWLHPHTEGSAAVITKFVEHAFPYRNLLTGHGFGSRRNQMLDAIAGLLVELHLAGCYWGDCSLSNVLCRFDGGEIEAIMIDAETSELHPSLSDGQRLHDLETMNENVAGEMADIAAMSDIDLDHADITLGEDVTQRYHGLWAELTEDLVITRDEGHRIRERIGRLNDLGFSVHDMEIFPKDNGNLIRLNTHIGGRTFNSDRLFQLTGVEASENQAKVILGDLNYFLSKEGVYFLSEEGVVSETRKSVATFRWLTSSFEPLVRSITEVWHGEDPVQGYCDYLHHRMTLALAGGADVSNEEAFASWVADGFPGFPTD